MITYKTNITQTTIFIEAFHKGDSIGWLKAYGDSISMMEIAHTYVCSDDLIDISYEYNQVINRNGDMRILEVNVSSLKKEYRGKKIGKQLYLEAIKNWKNHIKAPFVMIPEKCSTKGSTTREALFIWKSLQKDFKHSGLCIVVL